MSKNINNIDDLLRESFEDFSSAPSPETRAKVSTAVRSFNFFRFSLGNFNIFYMTAIIIGGTMILGFTTGIFSSDSEKRYQKQQNNILRDTINESSEINTNNSETDVQKNTNSKYENNYLEKHNVFSVTKMETVSNPDESFSQETITNESNGETLTKEVGESNLQSGENKIVYDTIVETVKVLITDTITKEVHQTVEMKKNKKNKK
jgi:hypothetical protein